MHHLTFRKITFETVFVDENIGIFSNLTCQIYHFDIKLVFRCSIEEKTIFNGNSTMNRQCGPLTRTTTPTESTVMFDVNRTVETSSTPTSPSSDGNQNFQKLIRFV